MQVLGEIEEEPHHVFRLAAELGAQVGTLGRDSRRAGIEVALTRHVATDRHQHCRAEGEFIRAQQRRHQYIARSRDAAIHPQTHPAPQAVEAQHLLGLGQAKLPRIAGVLDAAQRRSPGTAAMSSDVDVVGIGFGDTGRHCSYAQLRDQLDAHSSPGIDALQVVNQLRQIFDAVDVVMRRRADQRDSRLRVSQARDELGYFVAGKLAALARLGALRDLDLQLFGARQVFGGHTKASRSNLFDLVVPRQKSGRGVGLGDISGGVFATLAGVGTAAQLVHGQSDGFMCLRADGSQRHRTRHEAPHQTGSLFDPVDRQTRTRLPEFQQVAQHRWVALLRPARIRGPCLQMRHRLVGRLYRRSRRTHCELKVSRPLRLPGMRLSSVVATKAYPTAVGQFGGLHLPHPRRANSGFNCCESATLDRRRTARETPLHHSIVESEDVKQLRRAIAVQHRDPHLRHDLGQPGVQGLQHAGFTAVSGQVAGGLQGQPRTDSARTISNQHGHVMHVAAVAGLHCQPDFGA